MSGAKSFRKKGSAYGKTYFSRNCSLTINLERVQSSYDGLPQLIQAIRRLLENWDDVWALPGCSFRTSSSESFNDFEAEDEQKVTANAMKIITAAS